MGKFNLIAGLIGFGLFATSATQAQNSLPRDATQTINTVGCLANTDRPHQYSLTTDDTGQTFELLSDNGINIHKHVGQKVMITGTVTKEKRGEREGVEYLRLNQVKRVDGSC
jgi:hypothetical protein